MKIEDVLARIAAGETLSDEERAFVSEYKPTDLDAYGKNIRLKAEKKLEAERAALQTQLEELQQQLETASHGGDDLKRLQAQVDKLQQRSDTAAEALKAEREAHAATRRTNALGGIAMPWLDSVGGTYRQSVLQEAFADVDTDDLGDQAIIEPIRERVIREQEAFMRAPTKAGAGTGATSAAAGSQQPIDYTKPIDWRAVKRRGGQEAVDKMVDDMWAQPPAQSTG